MIFITPQGGISIPAVNGVTSIPLGHWLGWNHLLTKQQQPKQCTVKVQFHFPFELLNCGGGVDACVNATGFCLITDDL